MRRHSGLGFALLVVVFSTGTWAAAQGLRPGRTPPAPPVEAAQTQPAEQGGPRLELSPTVFNFGEVWEGMPARQEFAVKNTGDAPLTLTLKTYCGCTPVTRPKSPLPPGESTTFTVSYSTKRKGPAHKRVTLVTNDPRQPSVGIQVQGTVKALIDAAPSDRIVFPELDVDSEESLTVVLKNRHSEPVRLKLKEGEDYGPFEILLKETEPGQLYELTARTKPPLAVGRNNLGVVLETGLKDAPTTTIYVQASVPPQITYAPRQLLVTARMDHPTHPVVRVIYRKAAAIKITDMKSSHPAVQVDMLPANPDRVAGKTDYYQVRINLPPYDEMPADGATVEIFTDSKLEEFQKLVVSIVKHKLRTSSAPAVPPQKRPNDAAQRGGRPTTQPTE